MKPAAFASSSALALTLCLAKPLAAQNSASPTRIDVAATDFAFIAFPTSVVAGPTVFSLVNRGKVNHELAIVRLKADATLEDFVKAGQDIPRRAALVERFVGILIAGPEKRPDGTLLTDLVKGATYVVYCNLREKPDAPGHLMFGMYTSFTAR
jgi:uncharacterized cupredoxin-like copper-binding protein